MSRVVKAKEAAEFYNISESHLRRQARDGKIQVVKTEGGKYQYILPALFPEEPTPDWCENILYCRVSSRKQQGDLERQCKSLQDAFPDYKIVKDVASGINFKRKGFQTILEQLFKGNVRRVVVAHQDRFSRIGFEFFQWLFGRFNAVLESVDVSEKSDVSDMLGDIMEIFTVFSARYYGKRKYSHQEDKDISDQDAEEVF